MNKRTVIVWFRQDLRLNDNPALYNASKFGNVLPIYIHDEKASGDFKPGAASKLWLHESLISLNNDLNNKLNCFTGDSKSILLKLIQKHNIKSLYFNRCYEPWRIKQEIDIEKSTKNLGIEIFSFNGSLLWEPWENLKKDGTPYKVFTPFYQRGCLLAMPPRKPNKKPTNLNLVHDSDSITIESLKLLPNKSWHEPISNLWQAGEKAAQKKLKQFLKNGIKDYKEGRNFPAKQCVSQLSPYLHIGSISPNEVWHAAKSISIDSNVKTFLSELGWREFSYSLLYHFPSLPKKNWQQKFNNFNWKKNNKHLKAWQQGLTGYPLVDAGMRELWQTGYMHNRVRMVVASFLVKNLLIHWHEGERWFWDCLIDADLASNSASWQWVAGCGADAAPFFRIFNPVTQGQKFDKSGEYTKKYVPELALLPDKYLFNPWEAPDDVLAKAKIILGKTYPRPIVDLKISRERALLAYNAIKLL